MHHPHPVSNPLLNNDAIAGDFPTLEKDFDPFGLEADDLAGEDVLLTFDTDFDS